jgi:uncharacterized membrane protein YoaK (UPF0700 family)
LTRIRRYIENAGAHQLVINALVLGYVVYLQVQLARSGAAGRAFVLVISIPAAVIGLLGPRLVLGWLVEHATRVLGVMRWVWFAVMALIASWFFGFVTPHLLLLIPVLFLIFLFHGVQFWLFSDDRIFTGRSLRFIRASGES